MALTANSFIDDVARYLSDFDEDESYVHWSREDLLSYFKKAVSIVTLLKRDKFIKRTEVVLKAGSVQDIPDSCQSDVSVYGLADEDGNVTSLARRAFLTKFPPLGMPMCKSKVKAKNGYTLSSYDYVDGNERQIIVDPPVPEGETATLIISCYSPPEITSDDAVVELGSDLEAAVFELMLYYAWGVDIEDTASRERSNTHWANAMNLLKLNAELQLRAKQVARR